ncbi:transposase [Streptomyces sp. NPDC005728]|uniref:IS701 family transposase n=1 Tax=Streptomyces sp. NPDC005728 TaxID=3157054 RepID=UPI0033FE7567
MTRELAGVLFASFARRDQRKKGEQYLRGLLQVQGRKSIRNIAAQVGGPAAEQSLHHFISSSTWDWMPVREALAAHLAQLSAPQAWVVHPMSIPKAGDQSVGVDYGLDPCLGVFRGQRAFGVWHASETLNTPVNWRLYLPDSWMGDDDKRRRAEIPEGAGEETLEETAASAFLDTMSSWRLPSRPVVLNTHIGRVESTIGRFTDAGVPVIARIGDAAQLMVHDPALPGYGGGALAAGQILASVKGLRRPVEWADQIDPWGARRSSLAVAVRVGAASGHNRRPGHGGAGRDLKLLGEWQDTRSAPGGLWVTNMVSVPTSALVRLTKLGGRACRDLSAVGEDVGLKDFEGRSFRGWHRHITLASAAYAVAALTRTHRCSEDYVPRSA